MSRVRDFVANTRGNTLKPVAISAAVVAFASLALTQLLDRATRDGSLPHIAIVTSPGPDLSRRMAALPRPSEGGSSSMSIHTDSTPIASLGGRSVPAVVLDPCSGQSR